MIGNERARGWLRQSLKSGRVGQTLLFSGPEGVGKRHFALELGEELLCCDEGGRRRWNAGHHPDLHLYRPSGKGGLHSIQSMRELRDEVAMRPSESPYSCFILDDAERMLPTSANALLKTFEEPPPHALLILITSQPEALLPTIRSRCRTLSFTPLSIAELSTLLLSRSPGLTQERALRLAVEARGSAGRALHLLEHGEDVKRQALLALLARGEVGSYSAVHRLVSELSELFEAERKAIEEQMAVKLDDLSAAQREELEKEVEGAVGVAYLREVDRLLEELLGWYRDLDYLRAGGEGRGLFHPDWEAALRTQPETLSLAKVAGLVRTARGAIELGGRFDAALEALFLQLAQV